MTVTDPLNALRKRHYALAALPATIHIPALAERRAAAYRPLSTATVDDVAFAILGLEAEYGVIADRLFALRRLYTMARQAGASGFERIVEAVPAQPEVG